MAPRELKEPTVQMEDAMPTRHEGRTSGITGAILNLAKSCAYLAIALAFFMATLFGPSLSKLESRLEDVVAGQKKRAEMETQSAERLTASVEKFLGQAGLPFSSYVEAAKVQEERLSHASAQAGRITAVIEDVALVYVAKAAAAEKILSPEEADRIAGDATKRLSEKLGRDWETIVRAFAKKLDAK